MPAPRATTGSSASPRAADNGKRRSVGEGSGLEACAVHAEGVLAIVASAPHGHRRVQPGVVHASAVVDDQQREDPLGVTQEVHDDLVGPGVDGVVDEVGDLETVALIGQSFAVTRVWRQVRTASCGDVVLPVGTGLVGHASSNAQVRACSTK